MKAAHFSAGLGDVIRTIYLTGSHHFISHATSPVPVVVASHNPFTMEIFRHHRNAKNFILYDLAHKYIEFLDSGLRGPDITRALCEFIGLNHEDVKHPRVDGYQPVFDAPDDIASTGHIVFQPFAGNANYRTLPDDMIDRITSVLRKMPCQVFVITRSYLRAAGGGKKAIHAEEDARRLAGGNITVLENLSVPASINLVKTSRAYVGSWSSLQQAAWFENKPVAVFYPVDYIDVKNRTGYAFGIDRPDCLHCEYPQFREENLEEGLGRW